MANHCHNENDYGRYQEGQSEQRMPSQQIDSKCMKDRRSIASLTNFREIRNNLAGNSS